MSDTPSTAAESAAETAAESSVVSDAAAAVEASLSPGPGADAGAGFSERYSEILGRVNELLDQVDWSQMGRIGKVLGILVVVIVAQVLIKGVLDTINLLPIVPGLLELLGLVVVGQWSWKNLTTGEKRQAVMSRIQNLRSDYLG
ncbi:CAAD domain-containing protein [Cyanobium sp. ATX 6A2]|jgi:hypothetical protein|uniref:CAAD domain-containing protein n=1 Tax=Cyanobium sp. ATX 6A2 TaxID=2823700 RepID=UPI0020CF0ED2|nr:CAAD domain-containing protein [Cyanobium sp. ATX 6A2]MCP9887924.1 CAAD domain-containing protein [Cyanobium sp. ATX 6A2]